MVLHERFVDLKRSKSEEELLKRLEESVTTAKKDLELLREILDRIYRMGSRYGSHSVRAGRSAKRHTEDCPALPNGMMSCVCR